MKENAVHARDRATIFANTISGIVEDAAKPAVMAAIEIAVRRLKDTLEDIIKDAIECALHEARAAVTNALRDEFADLTRQVINENRINPET
jgi:hypothetical protein